VAGLTAWQHFLARPLMFAALVYLALWSLYYVYMWRRHAAAEPAPGESGVLDTLRYQRRQLERQRDARRNYWRRFGPALLPGCALLLAGLMVEDPVPWLRMGFLVGWLIVSMSGVAWYMNHEARRFQREMDALDSLVDGR
jgi:hypothetical protein